MTTEEYLQRIRARCTELLALAEKRTQGKWIHYTGDGCIGNISTPDLDSIAQTQERVDVQKRCGRIGNNQQRNNNAAFIASCAGPAEAGWKATIAAIDGLLPMANLDGYCVDGSAKEILVSIIAAWPAELL